MNPRPSKHSVFMRIAFEKARRATCPRRQVGCVIVDVHGNIAGTGYNGVPRKFPHCGDSDSLCQGDLPSGVGREKCQAVHAEINALLQCRDVNRLRALYCTVMCCPACVKILLNTSLKEIYFVNDYVSELNKKWWLSSGRKLIQMKPRNKKTEPSG